MTEIAIMVEGQNGLNWPRWQRLARAVEDLGFAGLYRSDHYTNANPPDLDSLELWVSLTWLASHTSRIAFGPLVSPVSFRHPTFTARMAAAVDDLSSGRLVLGLGAGWQEREHANYGWDLLETHQRFVRFEEGLRVISGLLHSDRPLDFEGRYYKLKDAILLPRPARPDGPPILIGGNGVRRTMPLVARYPREWNAVFLTPENYRQLNGHLDGLLHAQGRLPSEIRRSIMVGCVYAQDQDRLEQKVADRTHGKFTIAELRQRGVVAGAGSQISEEITRYTHAGAACVMLQWLDLDDL